MLFYIIKQLLDFQLIWGSKDFSHGRVDRGFLAGSLFKLAIDRISEYCLVTLVTFK